MNQRILISLISLCVVLRLDAASLVRVTGVVDGRTLLVDQRGVAEQVTLAGVEITNDAGARTLLEWTLVSSWALLESQPGGGHLAYRSPDALFINRELVLRGFARATMPSIEPAQHVVVTYLGTIDSLPKSGEKRRSKALQEGAAKTQAAVGTGNGRKRPRSSPPSRPRQRPKP